MRVGESMSKIVTLRKTLTKNPGRLVRVLGAKGLLNWVPDKVYLKIAFRGETGRKLNLSNPQSYNEKIQWLKLYNRKEEYIQYVDKYEVRSYVSKTIGDQNLIPLIGVFNNVEEINWADLPEKFVIKCTHGSGSNIICSNKSQLDITLCKEKLDKWMKKNWYWFGREWAYKNVKPRIICEQFIETLDGKAPTDYKFMCFNGKPKYIQVHTDRFGSGYTNDFYDINWNKTGISQGVPNSDMTLPKPQNLDVMLNIARKLSKKIPYSRIDLYDQNGAIFFGEITLYPTSGFKNFSRDEDDYLLGQLIQLPKI